MKNYKFVIQKDKYFYYLMNYYISVRQSKEEVILYFNINRDLLSERKGIFTAEEIYSQPNIWKDVINNIYNKQDKIKKFIHKFLESDRKRIILTGNDSLNFACEVCAQQLSSILGFTVESVSQASIVVSPNDYLYEDTTTLLISFSRSGNSQECVAAVDLANLIVTDLYHLIITCNDVGEIVISSKQTEKNLVLLMPQQSYDRGFMMTGSFTSMIVSCLAVFFINDIENFRKDTINLCEIVEEFIKNNIDKINDISKLEYDEIIYLGSSVSKFIAKDSSFKLSGITRGIVNSSYATSLEFRYIHEIAKNNKSLAIIYLSDNEYTRRYELDLARYIINNNIIDTLVIVTSNKSLEYLEITDYIFELGKINNSLEYDMFLPIQQVVFGQIVAYMTAFNLGIEPDDPFSNSIIKGVVQDLIIYTFQENFSEACCPKKLKSFNI